jgi:phospholipase C
LGDISFLQFARSKDCNTAGAVAQKIGVSWPPPPTVSVRNLVLVGSRVIEHVFVLMLENRSFDHMLGFSGIAGTDAVSGQPTTINGLTGAETNNYSGGGAYGVLQPADYVMPVDPGHEFPDVLVQLCGAGAAYPPAGAYPTIFNSGFVDSYASAGGSANPGEIMKCYSSGQLPVLDALAEEFVVCDNWYASLPGPTWPNRFFVHAASSGGLDHSPTTAEIALWETADGFSFKNGTIFDRMNINNIPWRLYAGDDFPVVAGLKGIQLTQVHSYNDFLKDVADPAYPASYTFIEPSYNVLSDYKCSTSQHPLDDVTRGESLIKFTYEAIRNSPIWNNSLLIITWDEHGGFFDHVAPPPAVAPGDTVPGSEHNQYGFTFEQYGPRVVAVVVSPRIPRNMIDHRIYDHSSIPATLERCFGLGAMSRRDADANDLSRLLLLTDPRGDAPSVLPPPVDSGVGGCDPVSFSAVEAASGGPMPVSRPDDSVNEGNLPGILHAALRADLGLAQPAEKKVILARFAALRTRADGTQYLDEVRQKVRAATSVPSRRLDLR